MAPGGPVRVTLEHLMGMPPDLPHSSSLPSTMQGDLEGKGSHMWCKQWHSSVLDIQFIRCCFNVNHTSLEECSGYFREKVLLLWGCFCGRGFVLGESRPATGCCSLFFSYECASIQPAFAPWPYHLLSLTTRAVYVITVYGGLVPGNTPYPIQWPNSLSRLFVVIKFAQIMHYKIAGHKINIVRINDRV